MIGPPAPPNPRAPRLLVWFLVLAFLPLAPARAQLGAAAPTDAIVPTARFAAGFAVQGRWSPVIITAPAQSAPWGGVCRVRWTDDDGFGAEWSAALVPFAAAPDEPLRLETTILPHTDFWRPQFHLRVELFDDRGRRLGSADYATQPGPRQAPLEPVLSDVSGVVLLGPDAAAIARPIDRYLAEQGIETIRQQARAAATGGSTFAVSRAESAEDPRLELWRTSPRASLLPADFPRQPAAYEFYDRAVLSSGTLDALDDPQREALARWVRRGGSLVLIADRVADLSWLFTAGPVAGPPGPAGSLRVTTGAAGAAVRFAPELERLGWRPISSEPPDSRLPALAVGATGPVAAGRASIWVQPGEPWLDPTIDPDPLLGRWLELLDARAVGSDGRTDSYRSGYHSGSRHSHAAIVEEQADALLGDERPNVWPIALVALLIALGAGPLVPVALRRNRRESLTWTVCVATLLLAGAVGWVVPELTRAGGSRAAVHSVTDIILDTSGRPAFAWRSSTLGLLPARSGRFELADPDAPRWWAGLGPWDWNAAATPLTTRRGFWMTPEPLNADVWQARFLTAEGPDLLALSFDPANEPPPDAAPFAIHHREPDARTPPLLQSLLQHLGGADFVGGRGQTDRLGVTPGVARRSERLAELERAGWTVLTYTRRVVGPNAFAPGDPAFADADHAAAHLLLRLAVPPGLIDTHAAEPAP